MIKKILSWLGFGLKTCSWCNVEIKKEERKVTVNCSPVCDKCFVASLEDTSYFDNDNWYRDITKDNHND